MVKKAQRNVIRRGVVAAECMYLKSLQDVTPSIVRIEGVGRCILRVADISCTRGVREGTGFR